MELVAPLGGRLNQHWLVASGRTQLVLRRWAQSIDSASVDYELRLLDALALRGWPVAPAIDTPIVVDGRVWSLAPFLAGEPPSADDPRAEQRTRGRLLAALHSDLTHLDGFGQRAPWRRCEAILSDPTLDTLLDSFERLQPEASRILRWHLHRARELLAGLHIEGWPGIVVHGDFTAWNLRFSDGRLSGILDFELAHWDHRIADFALSWRGRYDDVIYGYDEVAPLQADEWAALTPMWWAHLLEGACHDIAAGVRDDGWTIKQLLRRSPLMGDDAVAFR